MKRLIASDLHGSLPYCRQLLDLYRQEGAEQLVLLGDLAYSGSYDPRYGYDPQGVIQLLNPLAQEILWVEGNCDYGVQALGAAFPMTAHYAVQDWEGRQVFLTHGHRYAPDNPPPRGTAQVLLSGHTHVPAWQEFGSGNLYLNPGSVAIPKENSAHSYMMLTDSGFAWKDLEGSIYHTLALDCPNCG